eukprot:CAMPEP_0116017634 /NCGR_PEP_ID=MMETSP0321-20121206/8165_1 /TAXON_ID=163516 /ORGANISM="Leptocylindrus danicus var. danicus, Strain B650" /LENGTH=524 /DNA_ID=CAMNT_0003487865 /DNA_START=34 /DNA_END=1609 /DNA_ORIENTATION=-
MLRCVHINQRAAHQYKKYKNGFKDIPTIARAHFHATAKREILPLIGVATVAIVARYSYKALVRMEEEREEYMEELAEYEEKYGPVTGCSDSNASKSIPLGYLGVDLGSANIRIAFAPRGSGSEPRVIEDREGGRSTPVSVLFEEEESGAHGISAIGRLAKGKVHERYFRSTSEHVLNPRKLLQRKDNRAEEAIQAVIRSASISAMEKATGKKYSMDKSPFVFSKEHEGLFNLNAVFTYPVGLASDNMGDDEFADVYRKALKGLYEDSDEAATMIPEPIATIAAAEHFKLFPKGSDRTNPSLIIDVGADAITMSLVSKDEVISSSRVPGIGADILTEALAKHMDEPRFQKSISSSVGLLETDGMARQRMYDGAEIAIAELSRNTRTSITLPFLSIDPKSSQPCHLNESFSRGVLSSIVDSMIPARLGLAQKEVLSSSISQPNDLNALISSMAMGLFEQNGTNPFQLRAILMVGGGSRSPIFQTACREALVTLGGEQFVSERLIVPQDEKVEELTVLGAAFCGGKL